MKAITLSKNGNIKYKEASDPILKKDNLVKLKVVACGLCGSDLQRIFSDKKARKLLSTNILGHEISGTIEEIKNEVKGYQKGDRVVISPIIRKNKEENITNSKSIGKDFPGGFSEYLLVPKENLRKIPENLSFEVAALTEVIACALHAYHLAGSPINQEILIIGDGPIAIALSIICLNKNKVNLIGKNSKNKEILKNLGVKIIKNDYKEKRKNDYPLIFEAVGRKEDSIKTAIDYLSPGGKIIVLGVFKKGYLGKILWRDIFYKEGSLIGSNCYSFFNNEDEFDQALKLLIKEKSKFSKIITHIMPLKDFKKGLDFIKNKKITKAIKIIFNP